MQSAWARCLLHGPADTGEMSEHARLESPGHCRAAGCLRQRQSQAHGGRPGHPRPQRGRGGSCDLDHPARPRAAADPGRRSGAHAAKRPRGAAALGRAVRGQGQYRRGGPAYDRRLPCLCLHRTGGRRRRGPAGRGRRHRRRQDEPRPVRDRPCRRALALRHAAQPVRRPLRAWGVELRLGRGRGAGPGQLRAGHRHGGLRARAGRLLQPCRPEAEPRRDLLRGRGARLPLARLRLGVRRELAADAALVLAAATGRERRRSLRPPLPAGGPAGLARPAPGHPGSARVLRRRGLFQALLRRPHPCPPSGCPDRADRPRAVHGGGPPALRGPVGRRALRSGGRLHRRPWQRGESGHQADHRTGQDP